MIFKPAFAFCATMVALSVISNVIAELDDSNTEHPHPYSFAFTAGRYPGDVDRTRAEFSDDNGVVKGLYAYVDPRQQIRTVEYTADKEGFHPRLNIPGAEDTPAVASAKSHHFKLYDKIASSNENAHYPVDTAAVARAKANHFYLYEKIAEQHAKLRAEEEERARRENYSAEKY